MTKRGLALFDNPGRPDAARVREMHNVIAWMGNEVPALIDWWAAQRPRKVRAPARRR
ncbi:hypothetical protein [Nocardia sp. NPDC004123]